MITPVPKPRQTVADRWKKRPCVMRYRAFADELRELVDLEKIKDIRQIRLIFVMPMAKSWSRKKKFTMFATPHQQRPDIDNLVKSVMDALLPEDMSVWRLYAEKRWGEVGSIEIS